MSYVIIKAVVGYIVRPDNYRLGEQYSVTEWAAFDTWEQASAWIGKQFKGAK